jgi:PIN domain nuclease of toxin-antitoxin system
MYYTTDTHAFLWYLTNSSQLSAKAQNIFNLAEQGSAVIIVPAIVLLESMDILDKNKIIFQFEDILLKITQSSNFVLSEINLSLILEVNKLKGFKDIHDRVIVATAKIFDSHLISKDRIIKELYSKTVW